MTESSAEPAKAAKALLQQGRPTEAAQAALAALEAAPDDRDTLYVLAVARRYVGDGSGAAAALGDLKRAHPGFGRADQEEGHLLRGQGRSVEAAAAFRRAVSANPALLASWQSLADLARDASDGPAAQRYEAEVARLKALPPELLSVMSFLHEGRLQKAEALARSFLQKHKTHIEGMRLLAEIGMRLHILDDAEFLLESCLALEPDHIPARFDYVTVLNKRQKYAQAHGEALALYERDPNNPAFITALANQDLALGHVDRALELYDAVLAKAPGNASIHLSRGHAFKTVGKSADAVAAYRAAAAARPGYGDAYWSLANLKTYRFEGAELEAMRAAADAPHTPHTDRYHLHFALGKAFDDQGDADRAFYHYAEGNALKRAELRYSAERMDSEFARQRSVCGPELFNAKAGQGARAPDPIFILGLPRAGSTLIEQILASHSMVDGTLELPHILALAHRLGGRRSLQDEPRYPGILSDLEADKTRHLGEQYIEETRIHRAGAPFFTDKMPNNFRHIGLIHLILPNAKIIDARRAPMDCCFSCFKQLFAEGQEFTYGLEDVGRYYRGYVDLMDHWDRVLPGKILRVQHEDVIQDLEGQVRRLLEFCDLPFEEACVSFNKTERAIRTASAEQVRRPLNTDGVDQWRRFEAHLGPLKEALGPLAPASAKARAGPGAAP